MITTKKQNLYSMGLPSDAASSDDDGSDYHHQVTENDPDDETKIIKHRYFLMSYWRLFIVLISIIISIVIAIYFLLNFYIGRDFASRKCPICETHPATRPVCEKCPLCPVCERCPVCSPTPPPVTSLSEVYGGGGGGGATVLSTIKTPSPPPEAATDAAAANAVLPNKYDDEFFKKDYLDLEAGKKAIYDSQINDEIYTQYKILSSGQAASNTNIGIEKYKDWTTKDDIFGDLCNVLGYCLSYVINHESDEKVPKMIQIVEDFLERVKHCLITYGGDFKRPIAWGNNWYHFSVSLTCMCAFYLLVSDTIAKKKKFVADLILKIITAPNFAMGVRREGMNAVYLSGPYVLAKYIHFDRDNARMMREVYFQTELQDVYRYLDFKTVYGLCEDGVHIDHGFFFHSGLANYSYLNSLQSRLCRYFMYADKNIRRKPEDILKPLKNIILHPTIGFTNNMYDRKNELTIATNNTSQVGIQVIPSWKYLRFFTTNFSFVVRGQSSHMPYFESSDKVISKAIQNVQFRGIFHKDLTAKDNLVLEVPNIIGMITPTKSKEKTVATVNLKSLLWTAQTWYPDYANSYVLHYRQFGIMYQHYRITSLIDAYVIELIIIDSEKETIEIFCYVKPPENETIYYHGAPKKIKQNTNAFAWCESNAEVNILEYTTKDKKGCRFDTVYDLKAKTGKTTKQNEPQKTYFIEPYTIKDQIMVKRFDDNTVILYDNNVPKILTYFNDYNGVHERTVPSIGTFEFNPLVNQYMFNVKVNE